MWTKSVALAFTPELPLPWLEPNPLGVLVSNSAPLPKPKPQVPWPEVAVAPSPALTESANQPTIAPTRTFLATNSDRAITAVYSEIVIEWKANLNEQDPFEKLHFIPVSVELLAKLFDCVDTKTIDAKNIQNANAEINSDATDK